MTDFETHAEDQQVRDSLLEFLMALTPGGVTETVIVDAYRHAWIASRGYHRAQSEIEIEAAQQRLAARREGPRPCCHCDGSGRERNGLTCRDCNGTCCSHHYKGVDPSCQTCRIA